MKTIGLVGLGSIGRRHARLLSERDDIALHVMDLSPAEIELTRSECAGRIAGTHNALEDMLATGLDAVVIATPHHLHVAQARAALAAGCHVLCEKPVSHSPEEARVLAADPHRAGKILSFGFHLHFHPALRRLKQIIDTKVLGELVHLSCHVGSYQTLEFSRSRYQKDMFGALLLDYVHQPDLMFWLSGQKPLSVYATGARGGHKALSSDPDLISMLYSFGGNFSAHVHQNYLEHPEVHRYHAVFSGGSVLIDLLAGSLQLHDGSAVVDEGFKVDRDAVYRDEHQAFFDAIAGKRNAESPIEEAGMSQVAQAAALRSLLSGLPETIPAI